MFLPCFVQNEILAVIEKVSAAAKDFPQFSDAEKRGRAPSFCCRFTEHGFVTWFIGLTKRPAQMVSVVFIWVSAYAHSEFLCNPLLRENRVLTDEQ